MVNKFSFRKNFLYLKIAFIILWKTVIDFYRPNISALELYNSVKQNQVVNVLYTDSIESDVIASRGGDAEVSQDQENEDKNIQNQDEKLVKSALSKSNESDIDSPSLNKVGMRILEMSECIIKPFFDNPKLAQIFARLEKKPVHPQLKMTPMGKYSSLFVEGFTDINKRPSNSSTHLLFRDKQFRINRIKRSRIMYIAKSKFSKEELNRISINLFRPKY